MDEHTTIDDYDEQRVLLQLYSEVERRFTGIDDLAHGWEHISRVYRLALDISREEDADAFIVGAAALLHDLGRASFDNIPSDGVAHHADLSVLHADALLRGQRVPAERQAAILHAVLAHSFSKGVEPRTLEARIVRDADRLDALGAIGILRWAISGVLRHTPHSYQLDDPFAERHTLDDTRYMLDHFPRKLLRLEETMLTVTGRALARERTAFMEAYLDQLRREL